MKRKLSITFQILIALVLFFLLAALITGGIILSGCFGTQGEFDYLIVLGCAVDGTEPSPMLQDRIEAAAEYLEAHPSVTAVATGYQANGAGISEAQCIFNGLTGLGISPDRILIEDQATSTVENFQFSLALLENELGYSPKTVGILSSEFHLRRAQMIAKNCGVTAATVPAATSDLQTLAKFFLREIVVFWFDSLKLVFM